MIICGRRAPLMIALTICIIAIGVSIGYDPCRYSTAGYPGGRVHSTGGAPMSWANNIDRSTRSICWKEGMWEDGGILATAGREYGGWGSASAGLSRRCSASLQMLVPGGSSPAGGPVASPPYSSSNSPPIQK